MCVERRRLLDLYESAVRNFSRAAERLKDVHGARFKAASAALMDLQNEAEEARKRLESHGREHGCSYWDGESPHSTSAAA
jgi:hypothetical protein